MMFDLQNVCQMMLIMGEGSLKLCYRPWLEDVDRLHFGNADYHAGFRGIQFHLNFCHVNGNCGNINEAIDRI